jgi:hypothetical protein
MLEWIVFVVVILFILYVLNVMHVAWFLIIINIIVTIFVLLFIEMDVKKQEMHRYYLISLVIVAFMLVLKHTIIFKWFFYLFDKSGINIFVQALILLFVFPNLLNLLDKLYTKTIKERKIK